MIQLFEEYLESNKLPSAKQIGDIVNLSFGDSGKLTNCRIIEVHFEEDKVYYDVEVLLNKQVATRISHIDSIVINEEV